MILEAYNKRTKESILSQAVIDLPKKVFIQSGDTFKKSGKKSDRITDLIIKTLLQLEDGGEFIAFNIPKTFDYACESNTVYVGVTL